MTAIAPGVYPEVPYDVYAAWDAVRASTLSHETPQQMRLAEIAPETDAPATAFGTTLHSILLEPDTLLDRYIVAPKIDRRTKAGKEQWAEFEQKYGNLTVITDADYELIQTLIDAVWKNSAVTEMMNACRQRELSFLWKDEETGLFCKGRIDALTVYNGWTHIVDVKTCSSATLNVFRAASARYGYHRKMAWYRHGLNVLSPSPSPRQCTLLAIEKSLRAPRVVPYRLTEEALGVGLEQMQSRLRLYAYCRGTGEWPGHDDPLTDLDLPKWETQEMDEAA